MRRRPILAYVLVLGLLAWVACTSSSRNEDIQGGVDGKDGISATDVTSASDSRADQVPVTKVPCSTDENCSDTERCDKVTGFCAQKCFGGDCPEGFDCDLASGVCKETVKCTCEPNPACESDLGCGCKNSNECASFGGYCSCYGSCVYNPGNKLCYKQINCSYGEYCNYCKANCEVSLGICDPCAFDEQCGGAADKCLDFAQGGRFCGKQCVLGEIPCPAGGYECKEIGPVAQCVPVSGSCTKPGICEKDSDCPYGKICSETKKVCVDGCKDDDTCPDPLVCSGFRCQSACDDSANKCQDGWKCDETGHCIMVGGCFSSQQCPEKETYCDTDQNKCVPGCQVDNDCKDAAKICVSAECVEKGCTGNYSCAYKQVCNLQTKKCEDYQGVLCNECNPDVDNSCQDTTAECLKFKDKDKDGNEIDVGAFCLTPCSADTNNLCPQGFQCIELKDEQGTVQKKLCFRACWVPPV